MARRIAAHANTVEPCSANLTNRTARSCGTCGCLPNSVNRRTPVKTKQTGIPIQRSIQSMAFTLVISYDSANFIPRLRIEQYGRQKLVCKRTRTWIYRTNKRTFRSEEHTSELQSRVDLVCRLLLEKKKKKKKNNTVKTKNKYT